MTTILTAPASTATNVHANYRKERNVVWTLLHELLAAGYLPVRYDDGGECWEPINATTDDGKLLEVFNAIYSVDDSKVHFSKNDSLRDNGTVWFVLGNAPWEVVNDYSDTPGFAEVIDRVTDAADATYA